MELQNLSVNSRESKGKGGARQTRFSGDVPAILYGGSGEPVKLVINGRTLDILLHGKQGEHAIIQLDVADQPEFSGPAMVKEVQHHPVHGHVMHADFMRINLDEKIHTRVPIKVSGRAAGIVEGGILDYQIREVDVECVALNVPEFIEVDVTALEIGDSIHVRDLVAPDDVTITMAGDRGVVAVHAPRVQVEEETEAEGVEGEEGAEGAEGEAPADGEGSEGGEKSDK